MSEPRARSAVPRPTRSVGVGRAVFPWMVIAVLAAVIATSPGTATAVGDSGASGRVVGGGDVESPPVGTYRPPVSAAVVDPFRLPLGPYGPGNRGLEYRTDPGQQVTAMGAGRVAFVGAVAGRLVISIDHPDGRRSALTGLAVTLVELGDEVQPGQLVGLAGRVLHLGVREGGRYIDPASLFDRTGPARLVPNRQR